MTRKKKTRKTGPLAAPKKSKEELKRAAPEPSKHKGKGKKPGSRFNVAKAKTTSPQQAGGQDDPRFGSKKPITLVSATAPAAASATAGFDRAAAQAELQALENDPRLQALLADIEEGADLSAADEAYVDERTERFEQLAQQLGLSLDDDDDDDWEDSDD
jgi:ribosome assembly protein YihI (activator of Der GTPase)|tara:strand:+ start:100 stop:576 length:477 start_codon:yes stop_codon:yes gene_type:complete